MGVRTAKKSLLALTSAHRHWQGSKPTAVLRFIADARELCLTRLFDGPLPTAISTDRRNALAKSFGWCFEA